MFLQLCAIKWIVVDLLSGHVYSHTAIAFWNTIMRLLFFLIIVVIFTKLQSALENEQQISRTDPLTGVFNSRSFEKLAQTELERAKRYHHPLTLVYIDLDNFKAIKMADNLMYEAKNNGKNKIVHKVIAA